MRSFWLNFHLAYRCRHSLTCCSSNWPIPIERGRAAEVERQVGAGRVYPLQTPWLRASANAPDDVAGTLANGLDGRCTFLKADSQRLKAAGSCAIYSSRPLSCVHFPYVCLIDKRGVHVTLSHYCPTAASLLFDHNGAIEIVEGPSPVPDLEIPEGLDARESLPPLASPERLMAPDEFSQWERERIRRFEGSRVRSFEGADAELFDQARAAVPLPLSWPAAPDAFERSWEELVEPAWAPFASVADRYLAAKLFASWAAYLGDGTRAVLREVEIASSVLTVEATRQCLDAGRPLDAALLKQAIRQSDLLLLHYADRERLNQPADGAAIDRR